ncbi:MAG: Maf family protein [Candidatus Gracilibacteria bacterium]|jgi:septum formation protein|nr:Maf family protein [Candidatus Gracilibacteria bacterium]
MGEKIVLASKSPQRKEILAKLGFDFEVCPPEQEEVVDYFKTPEEIAKNIALQKALEIQKRYPDRLILAVDTIVVSAAGNILMKPKDKAEARFMILGKSDSVETVVSGIALLKGDEKLVRYEKSHIYFAKITESDADKILTFNEWQGRSGAFSVEGRTSLYIKGIKGCFYNIVGLPVYLFNNMLYEFSL